MIAQREIFREFENSRTTYRNPIKEEPLKEAESNDAIGILNFIYRKEGGIDYSRGNKFINIRGKNYTPSEVYKLYKG